MNSPVSAFSSNQKHICVCVCTYKRPELLERLLTELPKQATGGLFTYSIVVVDNDSVPSARQVVERAGRTTDVEIAYYHEPRRSISYARNLAVEKATCDFVAFIDDDEFPAQRWLVELFVARERWKADGILGPVKPHFEVKPPAWLVKSKLCERKRLRSGSRIERSRDARTGNVLLLKDILRKEDGPFDPRFGTSGGGDTDYFKRMMAKGKLFVWSDEACVYETVTFDRYTRGYYVRRALARGGASARLEPLLSVGTAKSLVAIPVYAVALPFLQLLGHHLFMRYLVKEGDHVGRLAGHFGIRIVKDRPYLHQSTADAVLLSASGDQAPAQEGVVR